jgi:exodeoxyribonuclease-3
VKISIATWNVNSVRAHLDAVDRYLSEQAPDVLCLQETKVMDDLFPLEPFRDHGYVHHALFGQKAYHGVAIFARARVPLAKVKRHTWCGVDQARHLSCVLPGGEELHNFYVPAGGDKPDAEANPKFRHKLDFMTEVAAWFKRRKRRNNRFILVGDLNVAPLETDVWNHKQLLRVVSHTPIEVEHMARWYASHDWHDAVRHFIPADEKVYSWWSYRSPDWRKADKGRRLDHIWVTPALGDSLVSAGVAKDVRGYKPASDHAPVVAELNLS